MTGCLQVFENKIPRVFETIQTDNYRVFSTI